MVWLGILFVAVCAWIAYLERMVGTWGKPKRDRDFEAHIAECPTVRIRVGPVVAEGPVQVHGRHERHGTHETFNDLRVRVNAAFFHDLNQHRDLMARVARHFTTPEPERLYTALYALPGASPRVGRMLISTH